MPRSKVRPNVSTYHEAVNFIISAIDAGLELPLTKKQDKFATKSLCYLAGMFGLEIDTKIQEIYATIQATYNVPVEFITWVRVMQQELLGVTVPASYGTFEGNWARVSMFLNTLKTSTLTDIHTHDEVDHTEYLDEELDRYPDEEEDQANYRLEAMTPDDLTLIEGAGVGEMVPVKPKQDWDTLAAKNPLAAAFVKSLISTPDVEDEDEEQWYEPVDDETVFDHHGTWEYPDTDDYSDEE